MEHHLQCESRKKYQNCTCISILLWSLHSLTTETVDITNRCCYSCRNSVEDHYHCISVCPVFADYHRKFIKEYYMMPPMFEVIQLLFNAENYKDICSLERYIFNSMKLRNAFNVWLQFLMYTTLYVHILGSPVYIVYCMYTTLYVHTLRSPVYIIHCMYTTLYIYIHYVLL